MTFDTAEKRDDVTVIRRRRKVDIDPEFIESHPVKEGYMEVSLRKAKVEIEDKESGTVTEHIMAVQPLDQNVPDNDLPEGEFQFKDKKGKVHKIAIYDYLFKSDLKALVKGQFFPCPAQVFPTINDRLVQTALNEKKAKFPEHRKEEKFPFWIILLIMVPILIILAISLFGGGG
jgi:hypothetical protein